MSDRFREAFKDAWHRIENRQWVFGNMGRFNSDSTYTFEVPGRKNFVYVTIRIAGGGQTVVPARNDAQVPYAANQPVKMRLEHGIYVIHSRQQRDDMATPLDPNPTGVDPHTHNDIYFTEAEHISVSVGAADAGKPIVLDANGHVDASMINDADISKAFTDLTDVPASYTGHASKIVTVKVAEDGLEFTAASVYTDEQAQDAVGSILLDSTTIDFTYDDVTPSVTGIVIDDSITNAKLANMAANTVKSNNTGSTADPADVDATTFIGQYIHGATAKTTPVDADTFPQIDSAAGNVLKKVSWANIKATLKTYLDTLYVALTGDQTVAGIKTFSSEIVGNAGIDALYLESNSWQSRGFGHHFYSDGGSPELMVLNEDGSLAVAEIHAYDSAGLSIEDDGGNLAIFVQDQGTGEVRVGIGTNTPGTNVTGTYSYPDTVGFLEIDGGAFARFLIKGSTNAGFDMVDSGASANNKRVLFYTDGGVVRLRSVDDANAAVIDSILSANHANGRVGINTDPLSAQLGVDQASTTAAIPVLLLDQSDLSEEFIEFVTTVGAGNPVDTAALGTYYGKARVSVNGTFKFIALYNS